MIHACQGVPQHGAVDVHQVVQELDHEVAKQYANVDAEVERRYKGKGPETMYSHD